MKTDPIPAVVPSHSTPTLGSRVSFTFRSEGLKFRRLFRNLTSGPKHLKLTDHFKNSPFIIGESISQLRLPQEPGERVFLRGKLENLRLACRRLNGSVIPAGEIFSFWKQVGPPWASRGFVKGREIRGGCVIPSIGGGLCQISGALFEAAAAAGLKILERHHHTFRLPDADYKPERDATVYWNYVDLQFAAREDAVIIEARMTPDELIVRFRSSVPKRAQTNSIPENSLESQEASSCLTCEQTACAHHQETKRMTGATTGATTASVLQKSPGVIDTHIKTAALLDEYQPEFDTYLKGELIDLYLIPARRAFGGSRYRWTVPATSARRTTWLATLTRAIYSRWASRRGRIAAETKLKTFAWIAAAFARRLPYDVEHLIVAQDYLPFLWKMGVLQGRSFDVLLTRPALSVLEARLDKAHALMPKAQALKDFRAPPGIVEAESEALVYAERVITPHEDLASLYPNLRLLNWEIPDALAPADVRRPHYLLFPSSLATREGAHAALEVAEELDLPLLVVGRDLEDLAGSSDLVEFVAASEIPWHEVAAVVHPTLFESWPRLHLHAIALEIPVICTEYVGLEESKLVTIVPFGKEEELRRAVERALVKEGDRGLESHLEAVHAAEDLEEAAQEAAEEAAQVAAEEAADLAATELLGSRSRPDRVPEIATPL